MDFDLKKLSTADLEALAAGDISKVSTEGLEHLATFDQKKEEMIDNRKKSGYDGIPDDQLNFIQKAEKFLTPPGHTTLFDPGAIENKKSALLPIALGTGAAMAATAAPGLALKAGKAALKATGIGAGLVGGNAIYRRLFGK